ncbi:uncharacterized membrane protein HdeD (DUF308 family) [Rhodovulum imhoffii]|uniref:Uncharacterized membrane protein HdeD (DUF308 family) n=1 Tax=Rhodovulum imhoffii TaxID=365340 RepID=A0A2T5BSB3_9RHOB|nr:DUF308 domain-containing protein [Rhodovulum imhoffii]PTN02186.1 uncharacterized membrane protein HdeD (DUF308 family) [Rhodovulum imhoffii]
MGLRIFWVLLGLLSLAAGALALVNPMVATLTAETLAGFAFLALGVLQIIAAFEDKGWKPRFWVLLAGLLGVLLGVSMLLNPLAGVLSLTLVVAILFLSLGFLRVVMSFYLRRSRLFWPMLLGGAVSAVLGMMILGNFPQSAESILGILLAVELLTNGVVLVVLGLMRRAP